jgi:hypothetical protein
MAFAPLAPRALILTALACSMTSFAQAPAPAASAPTIIDVRNYGAFCDNGKHDDTEGFRAAILAADSVPFPKITYPPGCFISDTLTFGGHTNKYGTISMSGPSEYRPITYTGPTDRPALFIAGMAAFTWDHVGLIRSGYANASGRGTSVGILLGASSGTAGGTRNTSLTFDHLLVSGFHIGMLAGDKGYQASEVECRQCGFTYNNIGFTPSYYNSLNFWFYGLHIVDNKVGVKLGGPWVSTGIHVVGGDSGNNTVADFEIGNTFDVLTIQNFRAQVIPGAVFLTKKGYFVRITGSTTIGSSHTQPVIDVTSMQSFTLEDSIVVGRIVPSGNGQFGSMIRIARVRVDPGTPDWPLLLPPSPDKYGFPMYLDLAMNMPWPGTGPLVFNHGGSSPFFQGVRP